MTQESPTVLNCPSDDEAGFRRAIDADPDNDTIRLIFADWLEERGDPRAAAIRKRCEQVRRIKEKFPQLKRADSRLSYWAAHSHRYQLRPPLPAATLRALEDRYGVRLPEDYFDFVVRIAEGGAGPSYGIESIQKVCWDGMAQPFPFDGTADPSSAYDLPDDAAGCILLAQHGCASDAFLVVSGSEAGMVWEFWGGGDCLWHPMGMTFLAWYESWLDEGLRLARAGQEAALWRLAGWSRPGPSASRPDVWPSCARIIRPPSPRLDGFFWQPGRDEAVAAVANQVLLPCLDKCLLHGEPALRPE